MGTQEELAWSLRHAWHVPLANYKLKPCTLEVIIIKIGKGPVD